MKEDSLAEKVYIEIRKKIVSNQLVPGTRLKEDAWAKKMEVSRVSIREALIRLLGESMLEKGVKGGYFVKSFTIADVKEIRELRGILELGAIELVCQKLQDKDLIQLEKICDDFTNMVSKSYFGGACEADVKFHETLIDIAKNDKLKALYMSSNIPLFHIKLGKTMSHMDDYERTDVEHRELLKCLKSRDSAKAKVVLRKHLDRGELEALDLD